MSIEHHVNLDEGDRDGMIDETKATETELPLQSQSALNWSWANKITRAAMATKKKKQRERNQRRPKEEYGKSVERKKKYLSEPYFEGSLVCFSNSNAGWFYSSSSYHHMHLSLSIPINMCGILFNILSVFFLSLPLHQRRFNGWFFFFLCSAVPVVRLYI